MSDLIATVLGLAVAACIAFVGMFFIAGTLFAGFPIGEGLLGVPALLAGRYLMREAVRTT